MTDLEHLEYLTVKDIPLRETDLYQENFLFAKIKGDDGKEYEYVYTEDADGKKTVVYISGDW
jgi:hypothetical protein